MNDRELLGFAAKAAGLRIIAWTTGGLAVLDGERYWQPLDRDGDALRLAVKMGIAVWRDEDVLYVNHAGEPLVGDPYAATRRAIVRAVAALAKTSTEETTR
jgi:hypothetical protein